MRLVTFVLAITALAAAAPASAQAPAGEAASPATPAAASAWEWTLVPYLWGTSVALDADVNGDPVIAADAPLSDLLDKLDIAGSLRFEARHEVAGFFVEANYFSLSDESTISGNPPIPDGTANEAGLDLGIYELGGFYRIGGRDHGFDLLFGVRYLDQEQTIDLTFPGPLGTTVETDVSASFFDAMVGARYTGSMGRRWVYLVRGDVAGGDTEFTWNAAGIIGFKFDAAGKYTMLLGYRHMEIEVESTSGRGADVASHMTLSGATLGFMFRF